MRTRSRGDRAATRSASPVGDIFSVTEHQRQDLPPIPTIGKGFNKVSIDLFDAGYDVAAEFAAIQDALTIKNALDPASIQRAANQAEHMAARASRLYVVARVEYAKYTRRSDVLVGAIRQSALADLEAAKRDGTRTKMITNDDVDSYAASKHPDEWEAVHNRADRAKEMLRYISDLAELATKRCYTTATLLTAKRAV